MSGIPSGNGTEVLKRTTIHAQSNTQTAFRWDGTMATTGTATYTVPTNHIITVLSITINEQNDDTKTISIWVNDGGNDICILNAQSLTAKQTFVWNDKFVLNSGDKLLVTAQAGSNFDLYCSYIDQDWS